jgi:ankyrin repeat protein
LFNISAADNAGFQPIHAAARGGNIPVLKFLLEKGAAIAATEGHRFISLLWTANLTPRISFWRKVLQ